MQQSQHPSTPLWTEQFAQGVTRAVQSILGTSGISSLEPQGIAWSSLAPQDIFYPRSRSSNGSGEGIENDVLGEGDFSLVTRVFVADAAKGKKSSAVATSPNRSKFLKLSDNGSSKNESPRARGGGGGGNFYALKHLKRDLLPEELPTDYRSDGDAAADCSPFVRGASGLAREALLLSRMRDHPHVVQIKGWSKTGPLSYSEYRRHDSFFLVLEMLHEETLEDRIAKWNREDQKEQHHPFSERFRDHEDDGGDRPYSCEAGTRRLERNIEKLTICLQIADALEYAHSKNVVHGNLNPGNVGFALTTTTETSAGNNAAAANDKNNGSRVQAKLMGFGSAREYPPSFAILPSSSANKDAAAAATATARAVSNEDNRSNNLAYVAPEVFLGREQSPASDVYSWGVLSYEVLSQTKPYGAAEDLTPDAYRTAVCQQGARPGGRGDGKSRQKSLQRGGNRRYGENSAVVADEECRSLLAEAWRSDPSQRPSLPRIKSRLDAVTEEEKFMLDAHQLARSCMVFL